MRATLRAILAIGLVTWAATCLAQSDAPPVDSLRFSGFGTLGLVHANAPEGWRFRRDITQIGSSRSLRADVDSRLGLQANYEATPQIELVGQLLLMKRSPYGNNSDSVQWAFAAWRPRPDWTLRVGRFSPDQYLMSDFRNVGFAYPMVRPPVDFYGLLPTAADGADLVRAWDIGNARWRVKGYAGRTHSGDLSYSQNYLLVDSVLGLVVSREADGLTLRGSIARIRINHLPSNSRRLDAALAALDALPFPSVTDEAGMLRERLDYSGSPATYAAMAVNDEWNDWQVTAEVARVFGPPLLTYEAGYVRVARHVGPVTAFVGVSRMLPTSSRVQTPGWAATLAPLGATYARQVQALGSIAANTLNTTVADQRTWSLGARWDLQPQIALKLQWDHVDTNQDGARLWANATNRKASSNVMSVTMDFVF